MINQEFKRYKPSDLLAFARSVVAKMTGNALFPTPIPALAAVTTKADEFESAIAVATEGSITQKNQRNAIRDELLLLLLQLASYVEGIAQGNPDIETEAGYKPRKSPTPIGPMPKMTGLTATSTGIAGEMALKANRVKGAFSYEGQYTLTPADPATVVPFPTVTKASAKLTGLTSLVRIYFRMRALGSRGPGPWSDWAMGVAM